MSFHQTDKSDLIVPTNFNLTHLEERAASIVEACVSSSERVCIVMMHTPNIEQIKDLEDCLHGPNKSGWDRVALVGGHLGLMLQVVPALKEAGFLVVEAKTERLSIEEVQEDGTVLKKSIFKHMGLRRL